VLSPILSKILVHPIKSLGAVSVSQSLIGPTGALALDRAWALYSLDGKWVSAKRTPSIHLIRAAYPPDLSAVTLSVPHDRRQIPARTFAFPSAHDDAAEWFSLFFEQQIIVRYSQEGFPDDPIASGPTIISTSSLKSVCEWFLTISLDEARLRFRTSLELDIDPALAANGHSLPAFWEDQLFSDDERNVVRFKIGDVNFEGSNPCARCHVPPRNPFTGETIEGFQKRFTQLREATLPAWSSRSRFNHYYRLATNTRIPSSESNKLLRLGDKLTL
jgi:uncharacterized protein YcbX